jgi:predicted metal-dependent peptidase
VVRAANVAKQRWDKHIPATVNQHATIEEAAFSVETASRQYNEDLTQLETELSWVPELAVEKIMARKELGGAKKTLCVI